MVASGRQEDGPGSNFKVFHDVISVLAGNANVKSRRYFHISGPTGSSFLPSERARIVKSDIDGDDAHFGNLLDGLGEDRPSGKVGEKDLNRLLQMLCFNPSHQFFVEKILPGFLPVPAVVSVVFFAPVLVNYFGNFLPGIDQARLFPVRWFDRDKDFGTVRNGCGYFVIFAAFFQPGLYSFPFFFREN